MDILDDMGVSKLSANDFLKVNYSFKFEKQNSENKTCELVILPLKYSFVPGGKSARVS